MVKSIQALDIETRKAALTEMLLRAELASARGATEDADLLREVARRAR